jgi:hypothetical protein
MVPAWMSLLFAVDWQGWQSGAVRGAIIGAGVGLAVGIVVWLVRKTRGGDRP